MLLLKKKVVIVIIVVFLIILLTLLFFLTMIIIFFLIQIGINKTVTNDFKILEKESPASSTATSNTGIQICAESLDEFLQRNDFEDVSQFYVNLNYLFVNKLYLNLKHIIIDHDVLIHDEDLQKNNQSCSMIRPDLEEVNENEYNYSPTTNNQTKKVMSFTII